MKMKLIKLAISLVVVGGVIFAITKFLPWKQIDFAVRHPVLVSGLQSAYNDEHQKADKNLFKSSFQIFLFLNNLISYVLKF